jgi:hypothetical protein
MSRFKLYPCRVSDITELMTFIFSNTLEEDKAQKMLVDYATCISADLFKHGDLSNLFQSVEEAIPTAGTTLAAKLLANMAHRSD